MPSNFEISVDVYLVNSKINEVSAFRRWIGVAALRLARWLLKSELRVEEARLKYWQVIIYPQVVCESAFQPSDHWREITKERYDEIVRDTTIHA